MVYKCTVISKLLTKPNSPVEGGKIRLKIIGKKGVSKNLNRSKLFFSDKFPNRSMCWSKLLHFSRYRHLACIRARAAYTLLHAAAALGFGRKSALAGETKLQ